MGQAQINVRIRACSRTSIARTKQAALTHNVRGKELNRYCWLMIRAFFWRFKEKRITIIRDNYGSGWVDPGLTRKKQ